MDSWDPSEIPVAENLAPAEPERFVGEQRPWFRDGAVVLRREPRIDAAAAQDVILRLKEALAPKEPERSASK